MHLKFASVDEKYIKEKVNSGFYSNETELVKDAVRHMRQEDEKIKRFHEAVRIGDEQIDNGETIPYSKGLLDKATKNALKRSGKGEKPNPDVTA